jgi:hypothetical protein
MKPAAIAEFDESQARTRAARLGYELTNTVQGYGDGVWFFSAPCSRPLRIGSGADVLRVLALHERWMASGNRARVQRWKAQKLRFPNRRPPNGSPHAAAGRGQ